MRSTTAGAPTLALVALALALAGCGGSKPSTASSAKSSTSTSTSTSTSKPAAAEATTITTKSNAVLETSILAAGPKKLTVYMFLADHGPKSSCYGACAAAWPPVTTSGTPRASGGASAAKIATIARSDGTRQVTYAGHPLYYYTPDTSEADVSGQAINSFGAPWYVLAPSGAVITKR